MYLMYTPNGWLAKGGGFTTQIEDAKRLMFEEVIRHCRRHVDHTANFTAAVPVKEDHAMEVLNHDNR